MGNVRHVTNQDFAGTTPSASNATPSGCSVGAAGTSTALSRSDHVHAPGPSMESYKDTGQTVGTGTIVLRSVPVPANAQYDIEVVMIGVNAGLTLSSRVTLAAAFTKSSVLFRSGVPTVVTVGTLGAVVADIALNQGTSSADVKITGAIGQTINWKCWTTIRKG
jgi:hypothetical protein